MTIFSLHRACSVFHNALIFCYNIQSLAIIIFQMQLGEQIFLIGLQTPSERSVFIYYMYLLLIKRFSNVLEYCLTQAITIYNKCVGGPELEESMSI